MKDGGPAFPAVEIELTKFGATIGPNEDRKGMTLRDWFAGMALRAEFTGDVDDVAKDVYALADAMLAEKKK